MKKAAATRLNILQKAFELIYSKGYQATSIDDIIATTQVTKGAFFYHFKTKDEMGAAIIEEVLKPVMHKNFVKPLESTENPLKDIYKMIRDLLIKNPYLQVAYGCPAGNLTQEMTPWNNEFRDILAKLTHEWQKAIQASINNGKKNGSVRKNVNARQATLFIMSGYWGIRTFGKLYNSSDCYYEYLKELKYYLKSLE